MLTRCTSDTVRTLRPRHAISIAASAAVLAAAVPAIGASASAYAAAPCSGPNCIHRDPGNGATARCANGAQAVESVRPPGGGPSVILKWSKSCHANWARFGGGASAGYWNYWVETRDGRREDKLFNQALWTWMVNGNLLARACIQGYATNGYNCTGWH